MTLWGGNFQQELDAQAWKLNSSLSFDQRLAYQDIRGSIAWAKALAAAGVISSHESDLIVQGLEKIRVEFNNQAFVFFPTDEDIHTAIERRLGELIGSVAGKLHTGRSRNDQVATDFRLWLMEHVPLLVEVLEKLQFAFLCQAERGLQILLPGYTHLRRAQPILLAHWWLSFFWQLERDRQRLLDIFKHAAILPLGCGALAGCPFPIDRNALAKDLDFEQPAPNSIDAVSDRDFAAEFLFASALLGIHLSKLAEILIMFSSAEFGFFVLSDAYATGSSLMPQKKNPDMFEIARGKSGILTGNLVSLLTILKSLPSTYDKDLQDDKPLVFSSFDTLLLLLPVLAGAVETITPCPEKMLSAIDDSMMATDLADYLVSKGVPFREAHKLSAQAVSLAATKGLALSALSIDDFKSLYPAIENDVLEVFDPWKSIERRNAIGGTSPLMVKMQLEQARNTLLKPKPHEMFGGGTPRSSHPINSK
ncbi:MAG: argininosuccinate lyase [Anaerolineae bacterium]|nr:argininosuccinate lyase [Anaerolineae bacterium]